MRYFSQPTISQSTYPLHFHIQCVVTPGSNSSDLFSANSKYGPLVDLILPIIRSISAYHRSSCPKPKWTPSSLVLGGVLTYCSFPIIVVPICFIADAHTRRGPIYTNMTKRQSTLSYETLRPTLKATNDVLSITTFAPAKS